MQPKVSVIVPVYKAEKYIRRCLDSLLVQTMRNFELLLIDDGSPDCSGNICDEYAARDARIKVFHKQNGGVGSSRQLGLEEAKGEYVIHADPDDYVEPNMLECLYHCAVENHADIVICDFYVNSQEKESLVKQTPSSTEHLTVLSELFQQLHGSCWNKLVKRTCYKQYCISFPVDVSYCEDISFWVRLLKHPVKVAYLPTAFYHYVQHSSSIVHNYMNKREDDGWKLMRLIGEELKDYPQIKKIARQRTAFTVINDAYKYGRFNSLTFSMRYARYVPFMLKYKHASLRQRLFFARVCLGFYSYYKFRERQQK